MFLDVRAWIGRHWHGALVALLFVGTSALYLQQSIQLHNQTLALSRVTSCQEDYNQQFTKSIDERTVAAAIDRQASIDERKAQEVLIAGLLSNPTDRVAGHTALETYRAAIAEVDRKQGVADTTRAENPLPRRNCSTLINDAQQDTK